MLQVTQGNGAVILKGAIDGNENFDALLGGLSSGTALDCAGVTQINSTGIKAWIRFFGDAAKAPLKLRLINLSVPLVEQLSMFRNFAGVAKVESIAVPFRCAPCNHCFNEVHQVASLPRVDAGKMVASCPLCGGVSQFDDLPNEYFEFLGR
jgi:hypothetical protein